MTNNANIVERFILEKGKKKEIFAGNSKAVVTLVNKDDESKVFSWAIYLLSEAGREVYNAIYREKCGIDNDMYYRLVESCFYGDDIQ